MGSAPQSIQSLLYTVSPEIMDILDRARFLARLLVVVLETLPAEAAPYVQVAGYEHDCLRLHAANASWGTRLHYMQTAIAQSLTRRTRLHVAKVDIRVRPQGFNPRPAHTPRALSSANRAHIRQLVDSISNPGLAAALSRLAAAGRRARAQGR